MNPLTTKLFTLAKKTTIRRAFLDYQLKRYNSPNQKQNCNENEELQLLENYSKCPKGTARCENKIAETMPYDLQIVIPVYKVEEYLRECVDSIIRQKTKYKVLIILVDDGSPDSCPKICDEYAKTDERIKVIHKINGGLSSARNEGIKEIVAKYIMFVDSDDRLIDGSVDKLMDTAYTHNADIVQGSYHGLRKEIPTTKVGYSKTGPIEYPKLLGFAWGKVFRSELFSDICFPEEYWFEDTVDSFLVYPKSKYSWGLTDVVYEYRVNSAGIMSKTHNNPKSLDSFWVTRLLMKERQGSEYLNNLAYFQKLKSQFVCNDNRLSSAPWEIREAVFDLSASMLVEIFPHPIEPDRITKSDLLFDRIIRDRNFKLFSKVAKWL